MEIWAVIAIAVVVIILVGVGTGVVVLSLSQPGRRHGSERFESRYERETLSSGSPSLNLPPPPPPPEPTPLRPPVPTPLEPGIKWGDVPRDPPQVKWGDRIEEEPPSPRPVQTGTETVKCITCTQKIEETAANAIKCPHCDAVFHDHCWEYIDPSKTKCNNCGRVLN